MGVGGRGKWVMGIEEGTCCNEHWVLYGNQFDNKFHIKKDNNNKKFVRQCSSSFSGIMENHRTHLAPGFTRSDLVPAPANVAVLWGLLGPGGFNSLYQMSFQQWNCFSPCSPRTSRALLCSRGFALPTRAPPGIELQSCSLCTPLVYSLDGI